MKKAPILTGAVVFICLTAFLFPGITAMLIFDREAVLNGEVWRLFSSHCVHLSTNHLIYNLFVFVFTGWIIEKKSGFQLLFLYLLTAFFICTALLVFKPGMMYYGGLSGIVSGLIYYCALLKMEDPCWRTTCRCITVFLPVKIAMEFCSNAPILPYWGHQPFTVMPVSHLMGVVTALVFYFGKYTLKPLRHWFDADLQT